MKKLFVIVLLTVFAMTVLIGCGGQPAATEETMSFDADKPEATAATVEAEVAAATDVPAEPAEPAAEEPASEPTPEPAQEPEQTSVDALYTLFEATGELTDMARYSDMDLLDMYGIDVTACKSAAGYVNASGAVDQVIMTVANDEATAQSIYDLLSAHVERLLEQYNGYDATAYATVQKAELYRNGNAVVLIISPAAAALKEICSSFAF